jgi:hypothetical protein
MNDGSKKKISDIKNGDILFGDNEVTACIKVTTKGSNIYNLDDIIVSDSHIVNYKEKWIPVSSHPDALKYAFYRQPYLYCLNTKKKIIVIEDFTFTDWDEIYENEINEIMNNIDNKIQSIQDIHTYLDGGFNGSTKIKLKNGDYKEIKDIEIDDILQNGEKVYGLVKINGNNVNKQFKFNLGKNIFVEGGPNLSICDRNIPFTSTLSLECIDKIELNNKQSDLYHLLTDKKTFYIDKIKFYDYNAAIDLFLEKNRGKLLSMKYV